MCCYFVDDIRRLVVSVYGLTAPSSSRLVQINLYVIHTRFMATTKCFHAGCSSNVVWSYATRK